MSADPCNVCGAANGTTWWWSSMELCAGCSAVALEYEAVELVGRADDALLAGDDAEHRRLLVMVQWLAHTEGLPVPRERPFP